MKDGAQFLPSGHAGVKMSPDTRAGQPHHARHRTQAASVQAGSAAAAAAAVSTQHSFLHSTAPELNDSPGLLVTQNNTGRIAVFCVDRARTDSTMNGCAHIKHGEALGLPRVHQMSSKPTNFECSDATSTSLKRVTDQPQTVFAAKLLKEDFDSLPDEKIDVKDEPLEMDSWKPEPEEEEEDEDVEGEERGSLAPMKPARATRFHVLHSREKEIIYHVNKYFLDEKANRGPLIAPARATARTAKATNVSETTVQRICSKLNQSRMTQVSPEEPVFLSPTPKRKRSATVTNFDDFAKRMLRRTVLRFYEKNQFPTVFKIMEELKKDISYNGCTESLRQVLFQMGFRYAKVDSHRCLVERSDIVAARTRFLREMGQLRQSLQNIVYVDETLVDQRCTVGNLSTDIATKPVTGTQPPAATGSCLVIVHAGTKDGFVDNSEYVFLAKGSKDTHNQINSEIFEEWFRNQLLPNIASNSVIVMDDAPSHSEQLDNVPSSSWRKSAIKEWLGNKGIQTSDDILKAELCELAKKFDDDRKYLIDVIAEQSGHKVVRLPPFHRQYNPMELIWVQVKSLVAKKNTNNMADLVPLVMEALNQITPKDWTEAVRHVEKLCQEDEKLDIAVDHFMDSLLINIEESSDEKYST